MENQKPQHYADITPEMIQAWKAKRGPFSLSELSVTLWTTEEGEEVAAKFVLAIPDQKTFLAVNENAENTDKVNQLTISNCVLGGDMQYLEQDAQVYAAVLLECGKLFKKKPASIKKL